MSFLWAFHADFNDKILNNPMAEIRGQPFLGHHGPSLSACFGSNEGFESSVVTAETGNRAWPMVP